MIKRFADISLSFLFLLLSLPLSVTIAIVLKVFSPGPIFFCQQRIGKNGVPFTLFKFRTMSVVKGAEQGSFDAGNQSRITKVGNVLRKTKLDELPQLLNVLMGNMSLVGPRPEVKKWTMVYPEKWEIVHKVKPGITDNASILFRNEEEILSKSINPTETYKNEILPEKLDLYIDYIQNQSFRGDLKIILKTFYTIITK